MGRVFHTVSDSNLTHGLTGCRNETAERFELTHFSMTLNASRPSGATRVQSKCNHYLVAELSSQCNVEKVLTFEAHIMCELIV